MNKKYTYYWTAHEDKSVPNNNYSDQSNYVILDEITTFRDYLIEVRERMGNFVDVDIEDDDFGGTYYILDEDGERTGEAFSVFSVEDTDEDLVW